MSSNFWHGGGCSTHKPVSIRQNPQRIPEARNGPGCEEKKLNPPSVASRRIFCFRCFQEGQFSNKCLLDLSDPNNVQAAIHQFEYGLTDLENGGVPDIMYWRLKEWIHEDTKTTKGPLENPFAKRAFFQAVTEKKVRIVEPESNIIPTRRKTSKGGA